MIRVIDDAELELLRAHILGMVGVLDQMSAVIDDVTQQFSLMEERIQQLKDVGFALLIEGDNLITEKDVPNWIAAKSAWFEEANK